MQLPDLTAPVKAKPAQQKPAQGGAASLFAGGGFEGLAQSLDGISDDFSREVMRSVLEGQLSQAFGFRVNIPDSEEIALRKRSRSLELETLQRQESQSNASIAISSFLNLDPAKKKQLGVDDSLLTTDPDKFLTVVNGLGLTPRKLTKGDLFFAGVDEKLLLSTPEQREAAAAAKAQSDAIEGERKQLAGASQEIGDLAATQKAVDEGAQGKGALGAGILRAEEGLDLSNVDEDKGSQQFLANLERLLSETPELAKPYVVQGFLARHGSLIKDQLEGLGSDEAGNLLVGKGDIGVTDVATGHLAALLGYASQYLPRAQGEGYAQNALHAIGLDEYGGINPDSLRGFVEAAAAGGK